MPPSPTAIKADPNIFAGAFLAGMEAGDINTQFSARLSRMKENWHLFREFIGWVNDGSDVRDFEARAAAAAAKEKRRLEIEALDKQAETERHEKAVAMHGAK